MKQIKRKIVVVNASSYNSNYRTFKLECGHKLWTSSTRGVGDMTNCPECQQAVLAKQATFRVYSYDGHALRSVECVEETSKCFIRQDGHKINKSGDMYYGPYFRSLKELSEYLTKKTLDAIARCKEKLNEHEEELKKFSDLKFQEKEA